MEGKKIALLIVFFLFFPARAFAATYYVATNGNDGNAGTLAQPFLTVQKGLNALVAAGDTLYIRAGTYPVGALTFTSKSGTSNAKYTISGYENERPILDANGRISGLWDNFIYLNNLQHVVIKNLEIKNSRTKGIYLGNSDFVTFQNLWIHHTALAAIWTESSDDIVIENSRFWQNNKVNDVSCTSANSECPSWYRAENWMGTLTPRGPDSTTAPYSTNITIRNNTIYEGYGECINAHGRVSNLIIEDNTIYNCWAPAVYFPNDKDVLIQRNLIYHTNDSRFLRGGNPGSAIGAQKEGSPTRPGEMKNIRIINNFVKGYSRSFFFWQAMSGYLEDTLIAHNTFVDAHSNSSTKSNNIDIGPGPHRNTRFVNNIVIQDDTTANIGYSDGSIIFSNNAWSKTPPSNMSGSGDIVGGIAIARIGNTGAGQLTPNYFTIPSNSPVINRATSSTVTTDYFGSTRGASPDIGAHEYTGPIVIGNTPTSTLSPTRTPTFTPTRTPTKTPTGTLTATPSPWPQSTLVPLNWKSISFFLHASGMKLIFKGPLTMDSYIYGQSFSNFSINSNYLDPDFCSVNKKCYVTVVSWRENNKDLSMTFLYFRDVTAPIGQQRWTMDSISAGKKNPSDARYEYTFYEPLIYTNGTPILSALAGSAYTNSLLTLSENREGDLWFQNFSLTIQHPGDANNDGKTNGIDYVKWVNHYGQSVSGPANGDFDSNNTVDGLDYVLWVNNYGK